MENQNNVKKNWRTRQEKQELILQWQQSGKSRKEFCSERGIGYNSLVSWCKELRDRKLDGGFAELKMESSITIFAQIHLPGGVKIDFYQPITRDVIRSFLP